jgi:hypothetical protein
MMARGGGILHSTFEMDPSATTLSFPSDAEVGDIVSLYNHSYDE